MRAKTFRLTLFMLLAIFLLGLQPAAASKADTIRVGMNTDLVTLDPIRIRTPSSQQVGGNLFNGLAKLRPGTGIVERDLATRWETAPDGMSMTFHLRKGVQFHKGFGEFTADDVKFTIERHLNPKTKSRLRNYYRAVKRVEVVDPYTVRIHFTAPTPGFVGSVAAYFSGWMLSRKAVTKYGKDYALNPIGTGPYVFESYQRGVKTVIVANEAYWEGPPRIKRAEFIPIPEASVLYAALESGDIDLAHIRSATVYNRALKNPNLKVEVKPAMSVRGIYLNTTRKPFKDVRVRHAFAHAINREQILKHVLGGTGKLAVSIFNPNHWGYTEDVRTYEYDPEKAKKLLAEAGYPNGFSVEFVYPRQSPYQEISPAVAEFLRAVGIKVKMTGIERAGFNKRVKKGGYDVTILGLTRPTDPDIYLTLGYWSKNTPPGQNLSYYSGVDDLIVKARHELDREKRKQLYIQIQKKAVEDRPTIPIYYPFGMAIMSHRVKGHPATILNELVLYSTYLEK